LGNTVDEEELNFMLSFIKGIEPKNQLEAMLAHQMVLVHLGYMKLGTELLLADDLLHLDSAQRGLNKLARTFALQFETLNRLRAGGEQTVRVQNVSVSEGGQAIVGHITQTQRENMPDKPAAASPLAISDAETAPMSIIEESKERVAVPKKIPRFRPK
jgi:hypothetical protein